MLKIQQKKHNNDNRLYSYITQENVVFSIFHNNKFSNELNWNERKKTIKNYTFLLKQFWLQWSQIHWGKKQRIVEEIFLWKSYQTPHTTIILLIHPAVSCTREPNVHTFITRFSVLFSSSLFHFASLDLFFPHETHRESLVRMIKNIIILLNGKRARCYLSSLVYFFTHRNDRKVKTLHRAK